MLTDYPISRSWVFYVKAWNGMEGFGMRIDSWCGAGEKNFTGGGLYLTCLWFVSTR